MKTTIVGARYFSSLTDNLADNLAEYEIYRAELMAFIGKDFVSGTSPPVIAEEYGHFWNEDGDFFCLIENTKATAPRPPSEIMCICGNLSFYISYGDYECLGTCTQCGRVGSLYSG